MRGAITVSNLGKRYRKHDRGRPSSLKGRILSGYKQQAQSAFWGVRHVTFSVPPGRAVGIVGTNGAGKSTLLRLIGGVGLPDEGSVTIEGRIGALLEIDAGLTEDLTGRENVRLLGVIAGLLRSEIDERMDAIIAFSELATFIDEPVRTYSTGMRMRLAFSVAIHTGPDVLLVDEVLAVGDQAFQRKCIARIREMQAGGCTILLVSHDEAQIRTICSDVLFMREGRVLAYGPLDATMARYSQTQAPDAPTAPAHGGEERGARGPIALERIAVHDDRGRPVATIASGEAVMLHAQVRQNGLALGPIVGFAIHDAQGTVCLQTNTALGGVSLGAFENLAVSLRMERLDLAPGAYTVSAGLYSGDWQTIFDFVNEAARFDVVGAQVEAGVVAPPMTWRTGAPADQQHAAGTEAAE
ncbi:ABC transporter ATP-binding protein [Novosphingobium huizhouense]|uniref:ABC transporter ATP-binding protein n=1 Tax=Novosphingobium huizhouense TaxID=2866625 RepID=UPI001CD8ABD5|nr:ABC transporter ATP-binding protein [Novosphingobium huizhouense]